MRKRPLLFSAPMVRSTLDDRKSMTRRVVKPYRNFPIVNLAVAEPTLGYSGQNNDPDSWGYEFLDDGAPVSLSACFEHCPYGQPGDRLWVRETWALHDQGFDTAEESTFPIYRADMRRPAPMRWRPSIHMPRWASRLTLEITGVRVQRLQDISEADAIAEGLIRDGDGWRGSPELPWFASPIAAFRSLWESIHGAGSWDTNPWVWVVEFRRIEQPEAR